MSFGEKTPKSELHEFFQLHPGSPTFDTQCKSTSPSDPIFVCKLKRPAIGALPAQTFTGEGRSKKMAEHNACKKALEVLRQHVFMAPAVVKMPEQQLPLDLEKQLASTHLVPVSTATAS